MKVFTVTKPGGTHKQDFAAYTRLLEDIGIDLVNVPRTLEPGTKKRWLYAWNDQEGAERFARELQVRTRDRTWSTYETEVDAASFGPVAPLDIYTIRDRQGFTYYLDPASRERIGRHFPHVPLPPSVFISEENRKDLVRNHGAVWWGQVCKQLTGLTNEQIENLGGFRIFEPQGQVWHEELAGVPSS